MRVKTPTYIRGSETERENETYITFWAKDKVRHFGASEGRKIRLQDDRKSRCSVIRSFPYPIDR